jgi:hypothetical protein
LWISRTSLPTSYANNGTADKQTSVQRVTPTWRPVNQMQKNLPIFSIKPNT